MFGNSSISETSFGDLGGVLQVATAEMSAVSAKTSVGAGTLVGIATMDGNFTATTLGIFITGSVNADLSSNFIQTSAANRLDISEIEILTKFTQATDGIMIGSGVSSNSVNFTKTSVGDIKFIEVNASATPESYTTINPSGTESWTTITPSGTESWTEIQ